MTSKVLFKFKTGRDQTEIRFNGPSIRTSDLVSRIISMRNMTRAQTDFDLVVENSQTKAVYKDEDLIPKNSRLVINRVSSSFGYLARMQGGANAAAVGQPNSSKNSSLAMESVVGVGLGGDEFGGGLFDAEAEDEDESSAVSKLAVVAQQKNRHQRHQTRIQQQQQRMQPGSMATKSNSFPSCGMTNSGNNPMGQQKLEEQVRRRNMGVPRNLLQSEENEVADMDTTSVDRPSGNDDNANSVVSATSSSIPGSQVPSGWMKFKASTEKFISEVSQKGGATTKLNENEVRQRIDNSTVPPELLCSLTKVLLREAVTAPCCRKAASRDVLEEYLIENDFVCPLCRVHGVQPSILVPNAMLRNKVHEYIAEQKKVLETNAALEAERAAVAAEKDRERELMQLKSYNRPDQILDLSTKTTNKNEDDTDTTNANDATENAHGNESMDQREPESQPNAEVETVEEATESSWASISKMVSQQQPAEEYEEVRHHNDIHQDHRTDWRSGPLPSFGRSGRGDRRGGRFDAYRQRGAKWRSQNLMGRGFDRRRDYDRFPRQENDDDPGHNEGDPVDTGFRMDSSRFRGRGRSRNLGHGPRNNDLNHWDEIQGRDSRYEKDGYRKESCSPRNYRSPRRDRSRSPRRAWTRIPRRDRSHSSQRSRTRSRSRSWSPTNDRKWKREQSPHDPKMRKERPDENSMNSERAAEANSSSTGEVKLSSGKVLKIGGINKTSSDSTEIHSKSRTSEFERSKSRGNFSKSHYSRGNGSNRNRRGGRW